MNSATIWCDAQVASIRDLSGDVRLFELATSEAFAPAPPGSHVDVAVEINGRPATRSYSLLGPGHAGKIEIAVKLSPDSRGGSAYMWALRPGAKLRITAPINHFVLNRDCSAFVLNRRHAHLLNGEGTCCGRRELSPALWREEQGGFRSR